MLSPRGVKVLVSSRDSDSLSFSPADDIPRLAMDLHPKQLVRVNVRIVKNESQDRRVDRSFSVDPRTITLDRLRHLIARALDLREDFSLLLLRDRGNMVLSCDWDLEGVLSEEPRIDLALELQPKEPGFEEWDIICPADVPAARHVAPDELSRNRGGSFLDQVLNFRTPSCLTEAEFHSLEDWPCPLRYAVYRAGGADPAIRPALWMNLLDVFPPCTGRQEREEFLNRKAEEYYGLRHSWQKLVRTGTIPAILRDVTSLVRKDVRRTDRALADLDQRSLFNVLTTYALHHPSVGYCQGMSDLLSPLLRIAATEARAYVAFCGLMQRTRDHFRADGRSVRAKFRHLARALRLHDPELYAHLRRVGALDLLFCYRWLLLDLKREFPYDEMLTFSEVAWSTLRPLDPEKGVELYEVRFPSLSVYESVKERVDPRHLSIFTEDHFVEKLRKNSSSSSDEDNGADIFRWRRKKRKSRRPVCRSWCGTDSSSELRGAIGSSNNYSSTVHESHFESRWLDDSANLNRRRHGSGDSNYGSNFSGTTSSSEEEVLPSRRSDGYTSGQTLTDHSTDDSNEFWNCSFADRSIPSLLPPPTRLGDGKPFVLFACLSILTGHRDAILSRNMDGSEIGMYFDRLVRKHRLSDVLPRTKELFAEYLRSGWTDDNI